MGNICRSPMAEAVFSDLVKREGLAGQFEIDSAGTGNWYAGSPPHEGTQRVLREQGIAYNGTARQIDWQDLSTFDYVLVMDRENLSVLKRAMRNIPFEKLRASVHLFLEFAKNADMIAADEVSDPYYHGRFNETYATVSIGAQALLAHIRKQNNLLGHG
jgi:protein-tyrosine phosphatase